MEKRNVKDLLVSSLPFSSAEFGKKLTIQIKDLNGFGPNH